jgi:hypothetical protein
MSTTYIEVIIREDERVVSVRETFQEEDGVTQSQLTDVFYDALRGAGFYPDGK